MALTSSTPLVNRRSLLLNVPNANVTLKEKDASPFSSNALLFWRNVDPSAITLKASRKPKSFTRLAKFQEFGQVGEFEENTSDNVDFAESTFPEDTRDDRCLPENLEGAIFQSSESAALFINGGGCRAIVELLIPELDNLSDEGSQQNLWDSARLFIESLRSETKLQNVVAIFPDAGVAALLSYQWKDASFRIASLNDRKPLTDEDELAILITPDHQLLSNVEKIASSLYTEDSVPRPLVMWNPKLISGDVGIGLNVRRLRESFLSSFTTVYSMRPMSSGAVYRCYPEPWKMFLDDPNSPGRYLLYKEKYSRPDADDIDSMFFAQVSTDEGNKEPSGMNQVLSVFSSFSRFMKSLSQ